MADRPEFRRTFSSRLGIVLVCILAGVVFESRAHGFEPKLVEVQLLADVAAIEPGGTFQLGVLFKMAPGWHVYWKNPGDAGLATSVKFRLPDGFSAGELNWPAPVTFDQDADIIGYGYDKQVLLWASVTASKKLRPGQRLDLRAEADWLACKDKCVIGAESLRLALPVAASSRRANEKLFAAWRRRLPVGPRNKASGLTASSITGSIAPGRKTGRFTIKASWSAPIARVCWYPAADGNIEIKDATIKTTGGRTIVTFTVTALAGAKPKSRSLETVLVGIDASGTTRAIGLDVPLAGPSPPGNREPPASRPSGCSEAKGA